MERFAPKVEAIYPTADTLPENLLRFYIQFSHSMKAVDNLEHIKLMDDTGEELTGAIFNNVYELWDTEQKQLTLILDPARVKTGLIAHEKMGRVLKPGKRYQLVIEKAEDIYGNVLEAPFEKDIFISKEDVEVPKIENWEIVLPKPGSKQAIKINFSQILDRLSLYHKIRLVDEKGKEVYGKIEIGRLEKSWYFEPYEKWQKGIYTLLVNSRLEDPAGNNLNGLFDHKLGSLKSNNEGEMKEIKIVID